MKLTPPKQATFLISVGLAVIGLLVFTGSLAISISAFWLMTIAFGLLALSNLVKNL
ncbi:MAG: hypothetical protein JXB38_19280 [Anaerolineales bacterium]|nr:hypothetical protein [Anaerolineales bacterium]